MPFIHVFCYLAWWQRLFMIFALYMWVCPCVLMKCQSSFNVVFSSGFTVMYLMHNNALYATRPLAFEQKGSFWETLRTSCRNVALNTSVSSWWFLSSAVLNVIGSIKQKSHSQDSQLSQNELHLVLDRSVAVLSVWYILDVADLVNLMC